jgi:uncharacterized protein YkwD
MRFVVVLIVALASASSPVCAAPAPTLSDVGRRVALEREILHELNDVRVERGLTPLQVAYGLRAAASSHSRSMLEVGFFDHTSADGTSFDARLRRHYPDRGWETWSVGETLLATSEELDARQIVAEWIRSRSHRAIVLSSRWREVGIGAQHAQTSPKQFDGLPTTVVTADFGLRAGRVSESQG